MLSNQERELPLYAVRLLPGKGLEGRTLWLPATGGGRMLPEIMGDGPRWLNVTLTVEASHAMAFELTACAALDLN